MSPFKLSSCCSFHVFSYFFSPSSYSWNEWNVRHFSSSQPKQLNLHFWRHFLAKHKILPNLVISNWLWWIKHVLLANQNGGNIWMNNNELYSGYPVLIITYLQPASIRSPFWASIKVGCERICEQALKPQGAAFPTPHTLFVFRIPHSPAWFLMTYSSNGELACSQLGYVRNHPSPTDSTYPRQRSNCL